MPQIPASTDRKSRRSLPLIVSAFAVFVAAVGVFGALLAPGVRRAATGVAADAPARTPPAAAQASRPGGRVEAELITIGPRGFQTTSISRPRGRFLLAVNNRSGLENVELRLDREAGGRLHEVKVPASRLDWRQVLDLPPGGYVLREANHPDWVCRIEISPN